MCINAGNQLGQHSQHIQSIKINHLSGCFNLLFVILQDYIKSHTMLRFLKFAAPLSWKMRCYSELDTPADTSLVGANCHVVAYTDKVCEVTPYYPKYKVIQNVPSVKAGTAYVDQDT